MSYKLNQKDPERRARILAKRKDYVRADQIPDTRTEEEKQADKARAEQILLVACAMTNQLHRIKKS